MTVYNQVRKAYIDSQKNNFWDAWGIVASPKVIRELKGDLNTIFGLVVIPNNLVENDKVYIVNEELGRTILGMEERNG